MEPTATLEAMMSAPMKNASGRGRGEAETRTLRS